MILFQALPYAASAADKDNNPPGPIGGRGTNWENPPGWVGGPGASPDRPWANFNEWFEKYPGVKKRFDANGDGVLDTAEKEAAHDYWRTRHPSFKDRDGNPPGPRGGPGTNWENRPGPAGGPGASPDRRPFWKRFWRRDRDNNPPGPVGGRGTNWENPRGPVGGPGASPNRRRW
jgi:hypothetical protein